MTTDQILESLLRIGVALVASEVFVGAFFVAAAFHGVHPHN